MWGISLSIHPDALIVPGPAVADWLLHHLRWPKQRAIGRALIETGLLIALLGTLAILGFATLLMSLSGTQTGAIPDTAPSDDPYRPTNGPSGDNPYRATTTASWHYQH